MNIRSRKILCLAFLTQIVAWTAPAFSAGGLFKEGMFRVNIRGVLEYDDNVYGAPDGAEKEDGFRVIAKLRGSFNVSTESLYASLVYEPAYTWYLGISEQDWINELNGIARYNVSERLKVAIKDHFLENQYDVLDVLDLRDSNDDYLFNRLMADLSYYVTPKISTDLDAGVDYMDYESFSHNTLTFQRWAYDASLTGTWRTSKRLSWAATYQPRMVDYVEPDDKQLVTHYGVVGTSWRINERVTADVRGGGVLVDVEPGAELKPTGDAGLNARLTRSTNGKIGLSYSSVETERDYYVATRLSAIAMVDHSFSRRTSAAAVVSYKDFLYDESDAMYPDTGSADERWLDFNLTIRHTLSFKWLTVFAYYNLTDVESGFDGEGYIRNRIGLGLVGNF